MENYDLGIDLESAIATHQDTYWNKGEGINWELVKSEGGVTLEKYKDEETGLYLVKRTHDLNIDAETAAKYFANLDNVKLINDELAVHSKLADASDTAELWHWVYPGKLGIVQAREFLFV